MQIFHNTRCSKSRATLEILEEAGVQFEIIDYVKDPPTAEELAAVVKKLGMRPEEIVRKNEAAYQENYAGRTLSDAQWIEAMVKHPILMERPIVVKGNRAVIGRPPERVKELL